MRVLGSFVLGAELCQRLYRWPASSSKHLAAAIDWADPLAFLISRAKIRRYTGPLHGEEITLYWHDIMDIAWAGRSELMRC